MAYATNVPEKFAGLAPFPAYVSQFEDMVGIPLYSDPHAEQLVLDDPGRVDRHGFQLRHELYRMVQYAIAGAAGVEPLDKHGLASAWAAATAEGSSFQRDNWRLLRHVRGELTEADEGNKPQSVKELELALAAISPQRWRKPQLPTKGTPTPVGVLPPSLTTLRSIGRVVDVSRSNADSLLTRRRMMPARIRLPNMAMPEQLVTWAMVEQLGDEYGFLPGVEFDFTALKEAESADKDSPQTAYARQVQKEIVPLYKLTNVPGLVNEEELAAMREPARPYELTIGQMEQFLEGGYHFLENYICKQGIKMVCKRSPKTGMVAEYVTKEEAAGGWQAWLAVPRATASDIPLVRVAERAGVARSFLQAALQPDERTALQLMRAQRPSGHVIAHIPETYVPPIVERHRTKSLSAFRVPVNGLGTYLATGYSANVKRIANMHVFTPKQYVPGSSKKHSVTDWHAVRCLEILGGRKKGVTWHIDYARLPQHPDDTDRDRTAYARDVQTRLGLAHLLPEHSQRQEAIEQYPDFNELDDTVQDAVAQLAGATYFTEAAIIRLLTERGHSLESDISRFTKELVALRAPLNAVRFTQTVKSIGWDNAEALSFLQRFRGRHDLKLDMNGYPDVFIGPMSHELLRRQRFRAGGTDPNGRAPTATKDWVHIGQILPYVNASIDEFYQWIGERTFKKDQRWLQLDTGEAPVLLHYSLRTITPFILAHKRQRAGGIRPSKNGQR